MPAPSGDVLTAVLTHSLHGAETFFAPCKSYFHDVEGYFHVVVNYFHVAEYYFLDVE